MTELLLTITHPKLEIILPKQDFNSVSSQQEVRDQLASVYESVDDIDGWKEKLKGDELYAAMGTTLKTAGSKEAQYKIDYTYQFEVAKAAAENEVSTLLLVSSTGSSSKSPFFYPKIEVFAF